MVIPDLIFSISFSFTVLRVPCYSKKVQVGKDQVTETSSNQQQIRILMLAS